MYGRSSQYGYKGTGAYDQYGGSGYDAGYDNYGNSYGGQYDNTQYGTGSAYGTGSYGQGHQSRAMTRSPLSPTSQLSPTSSPGRPGYGSPIPRRNNSPAMQISVPTINDPIKRMDRYRSCSPGRRNATIGLEGQQLATTGNMMNNNPYGRYNSRSVSPARNINIHPQSGVEISPVVRPSSVKCNSVRRGSIPSIRLDGQIPPSVPVSPSYGTSQIGMSPTHMNSIGHISPELIQAFNSVDSDRNGRISSDELRRALRNGDWSEFDDRTCRLMITMFDTKWTGTIDVQDFSDLWNYINEWQAIFDSFDADRSGTIDSRELYQAFLNFGYVLPTHFSQMIVSIYDKTGKGAIKFDSFISVSVLLKLITQRFQERDRGNTKRITLNMEQFIDAVLDTYLVNI